MTNSFMLILLLLVLLAVIVALVLYISSRHKKQMAGIEEIRQQLEALRPDTQQSCEEAPAEPVQENTVTEIIEHTEERKDAAEEEEKETAASAYNTGKSGKVYTKEELELLIKE